MEVLTESRLLKGWKKFRFPYPPEVNGGSYIWFILAGNPAPSMFPYPLGVTGGSYWNHIGKHLYNVAFPYPFEVTGGSYMSQHAAGRPRRMFPPPREVNGDCYIEDWHRFDKRKHGFRTLSRWLGFLTLLRQLLFLTSIMSFRTLSRWMGGLLTLGLTDGRHELVSVPSRGDREFLLISAMSTLLIA